MAAITGHEIKWLNEDEIEVKSISRKELMSDNNNSNSKEMISLQSENIRLLREKVQFLEDEIHNLKTQNTNDNNWKTNLSTFNIQSFITFKNKKDFEQPGYDIHQSVERKVEGNTKCLGYSTKELEQMSPKEFNNLYHPESINDGFKIISLLSGTTNSNRKYIPMTKASIMDCHLNAGKDMLSMYCNNFSSTNVFNGKGIMLGGSQNVKNDFE